VSMTLCRRVRTGTVLPLALAAALGLGWAAREVAHARELAESVKSGTITLDKVVMKETLYDGKPVGHNGVYLSGDTPGSTKFVTGRFIIPPGKTPHPPHTHAEEEVMIVESGAGEIFCDGKTTKVANGSVMYTTPNASHAILNTGPTPLVFYYIKWVGKPAE
jgi:mannose-6-phosphate isomerase-like protein (cupin superfamily)